MPAVPTKYPVQVSDGTRTYEVFDATSYVNAVYGQGHKPVAPLAEPPQAPPVSTTSTRTTVPTPAAAVPVVSPIPATEVKDNK